MNHVMIDLETMGASDKAAILSVSAVQFDLTTGQIGETFDKVVSLSSSMKAGLTADPGTILWWVGQSEEARNSMLTNQKKAEPLQTVLEAFNNWLIAIGGDKLIVWANSPAFDLTILKNANSACGIQTAWRFYNERCVRTLSAILPEIRKNTPDVGVHHNGLDDCLFQVRYTVNTYRQLKGLQPVEIQASPTPFYQIPF